MYDRINVVGPQGMYEITGLVAQGDDLDGTFTLTCDATGEQLDIKGWLAEDITVLERGVSH